MEDSYRWIFENSVPGLPEAAAAENFTPLEYMRRYGAFQVKKNDYRFYEKEIEPSASGIEIDGKKLTGFDTPSKKLEFYSPTMVDWGWPEHAVPGYIRSQVHWSGLNREAGDVVLTPTFRLPTLIHTRSANAKWLVEISHRNPLWIHPVDAERLGIRTDGLVRVNTAIGYFVVRSWVTEGLRPGIIACSHHIGRWRLPNSQGTNKWAASNVALSENPVDGGDGGLWRVQQLDSVGPFESNDPDSSRVWWTDAGVHQNLVFPVQPDPVSGMHCWHQKVRIEPARPNDRYGDVIVDTTRSHELYKEWLAQTRPAPGPDNLRRPLWFSRPVRPTDDSYRIKD